MSDIIDRFMNLRGQILQGNHGLALIAMLMDDFARHLKNSEHEHRQMFDIMVHNRKQLEQTVDELMMQSMSDVKLPKLPIIQISLWHAEVLETLIMIAWCNEPGCHEMSEFRNESMLGVCKKHKSADMIELHYMPAIRAFDAELQRARDEAK